MTEWALVMQAADAAARWHVRQRRKGRAGEPYIGHPLEVASLVAQATEGRDPALVSAALLHDVVEDCGVSNAEIAAQFGQEAASLVAEATDDKSLPKEERKRGQIDAAPNKSAKAKILKLADKTSNLRALATSPPADWSSARRMDYIQWARAVVAGLRGASPWLEEQFDKAAEDAERSCRLDPDAPVE